MHEAIESLSFILLYGVSYGLVLFTISVGLVVTMGLMRVINLAHGAFAAIGGYLAVSMMNDAVPFPLAVLAACALVALLSLALERLFYVPLYGADDLEQVLMTTGLIFLAIAALNFVFGPNVLPSRMPEALNASLDLGIRHFQAYRVFVAAAGLTLALILWFVFDRTSFGARLRAAVDNRGMAQAIGIDVTRLFSIAFVLGSVLAALGGAVGFAILPLEPLYPFKYLALILIVVSLSGFGNIKASALVAVTIGVIDTACRYLFPAFGAFIIYVFLVGIMLLRAEGLFAGHALR